MTSEYGMYQVSFTPTSWYSSSYVEPTIQMSISGEANLSQMLSFFESFLKAAGYQIDGELQVNPPESKPQDFRFTTVSSVGYGK